MLRETTHMLIDMPTRSGGNTNNGPLADRLFREVHVSDKRHAHRDSVDVRRVDAASQNYLSSSSRQTYNHSQLSCGLTV